MDFRFSEEQEALRGLAREIFEKEVTPERLKAVESAGEGIDEELWSCLAEANLLGLSIAENQGGMGMGFFELCVLLHDFNKCSPSMRHPPLVLFLVLTHPAQSVPLYTSMTLAFCQLYLNTSLLCPSTYLPSLFSACAPSSVGADIHL